jgi:hypothetical protein
MNGNGLDRDKNINERFAKCIRDYWSARGKAANVRVERVYFRNVDDDERSMWVVRSTMLNGRPQ